MAARKTAASPKPDKIIRDALLIAVKRTCKDEDGKSTTYLNRIAAKVVSMAANGDSQAYRELFDRIEGKVAQAITAPDGGAFAMFVIENGPRS